MTKRTAIVKPLLLALILGGGACVIWGILLVCGMSSLDNRRGTLTSEDLVILGDGSPVIAVATYNYQNGYERRTSYRTPDGKPVTLPHEEEERILEHGNLSPQSDRPLEQFCWSQRLQSFTDGREVPAYWYLISGGPAEGEWFEGYDSATNHRIGFLTPSGFSRELPARDKRLHIASDGVRFLYGMVVSRGMMMQGRTPYDQRYYPGEDVPEWMVYALSDDRVLEFDLREKKVRTVTPAPGSVSGSMLRPGTPKKPPERPRRTMLAIRLADRILLLDPMGSARQEYPLPKEFRTKSVELTVQDDRTAIVQATFRAPTGMPRPVKAVWISPEGRQTKQIEAAFSPQQRGDDRWQATFMLSVIPSPLPVGVFSAVGVYAMVLQGEAATCMDAWKEVSEVILPGLPIATLLSLAMAWYAWRRQRRYGVPWTRTWVAFVFLFGLPGLVGYLFHRHWPVRLECPNCHRPSPRDRPACLECHATFPAPAPRSTDIFA